MIFRLFRRRDDQSQVRAIYAAIVAQARQPAFYSISGVPDTIDGRYEMLMLHAFLYMHRLKDEPQEAKDIAQKVFDLMFTDMDRSLREIGIGDLTVPKKIKKMAQAFYGRAAAYDSGLAEGGAALQDAVTRNVFPDGEGDAAGIADYIHAAVAALAAQPVAELTKAGPVFSPASALDVPAKAPAPVEAAPAFAEEEAAKPASPAKTVTKPRAKAKAKPKPVAKPVAKARAKPVAQKATATPKAAPRARPKLAAKPKPKSKGKARDR